MFNGLKKKATDSDESDHESCCTFVDMLMRRAELEAEGTVFPNADRPRPVINMYVLLILKRNQ